MPLKTLGPIGPRAGGESVKTSPRGRILGRNPDKRKFSSLLFTVTSTALPWDFYFKHTQPLTVSVKENEVKNLIENQTPSLWLQQSIQKPQAWELQRLCPEISMKLYAHEYTFKSALQQSGYCFFMNISTGNIWLFVNNSEEEFASVWVKPQECCSVCTARNLDLCMPIIEIGRSQSHFQHSCVCLSYIIGILPQSELYPWDIVPYWVKSLGYCPFLSYSVWVTRYEYILYMHSIPSNLLISSVGINFVIPTANFWIHLRGLLHKISKNFKSKVSFKYFSLFMLFYAKKWFT